MTKVSLELEDIKALASDSRIEILKALDGKKLSLKEITKITKLQKGTIHMHLTRLLESLMSLLKLFLPSRWLKDACSAQ